MPAIKMQVLVLRVMRYNMEGSDGKNVSGCKVTYAQGLDPTEKQNSRGVDVLSGTVPEEHYDLFQSVPGYYEGEFELSLGKGGQASLRPVSFDFIEPFSA